MVVDVLWSLLKGVVWSWEEKVQIVDEQYQLYGHNLGYRRFWFMSNHQLVLCPLGVLYPPSHYCLNEACTKQKLQKVEQRRAILYTLGEGVCPKLNRIWIEESERWP